MRHAELQTLVPPRLPPLLEMPYLMRTFRTGRLDHLADRDRIASACGGVPHTRVVSHWLAWLVGRPKSEFPGGPIWYRYIGDTPVRLKDAFLPDGTPLGRTLAQPGQVYAVQSWVLVGRSDYERCDEPVADAEPAAAEPAILPWVDIVALGYEGARDYLRPMGIKASGWTALKEEYDGR